MSSSKTSIWKQFLFIPFVRTKKWNFMTNNNFTESPQYISIGNKWNVFHYLQFFMCIYFILFLTLCMFLFPVFTFRQCFLIWFSQSDNVLWFGFRNQIMFCDFEVFKSTHIWRLVSLTCLNQPTSDAWYFWRIWINHIWRLVSLTYLNRPTSDAWYFWRIWINPHQTLSIFVYLIFEQKASKPTKYLL